MSFSLKRGWNRRVALSMNSSAARKSLRQRMMVGRSIHGYDCARGGEQRQEPDVVSPRIVAPDRPEQGRSGLARRIGPLRFQQEVSGFPPPICRFPQGQQNDPRESRLPSGIRLMRIEFSACGSEVDLRARSTLRAGKSFSEKISISRARKFHDRRKERLARVGFGAGSLGGML